MNESDLILRNYGDSTGDLIDWAILELESMFESASENDYREFVREHIAKLEAEPDLHPFSHIQRFHELTKDVNSEKKIAQLRLLSAIEMAIHYAYIAQQANSKNSLADAKIYGVKTAYFVGIARGYALSFWMGDSDEDPLLNMAKSGGQKRSAKYQPLRDYALEAVEKRKFPSRRNAAMVLKNEVLKLAKELQISLSEAQAEKTITGWLAGVTFGGKQSSLPPSITS
jgi:hypothetical protein